MHNSPLVPEKAFLIDLTSSGHEGLGGQDPSEDQDDETAHRVAPVITAVASRCSCRRARLSWCVLRANRRASTPLRYRLLLQQLRPPDMPHATGRSPPDTPQRLAQHGAGLIFASAPTPARSGGSRGAPAAPAARSGAGPSWNSSAR